VVALMLVPPPSPALRRGSLFRSTRKRFARSALFATLSGYPQERKGGGNSVEGGSGAFSSVCSLCSCVYLSLNRKEKSPLTTQPPVFLLYSHGDAALYFTLVGGCCASTGWRAPIPHPPFFGRAQALSLYLVCVPHSSFTLHSFVSPLSLPPFSNYLAITSHSTVRTNNNSSRESGLQTPALPPSQRTTSHTLPFLLQPHRSQMPPVKAGAGPSPVSTTSNNNNKNNGGAAHDNTTLSLGSATGPTPSDEASLTSQDFVRQLLRIAAGDLSCMAGLNAPADANAQSLNVSGPAGTSGRGGHHASLSESNERERLQRDSQVRCASGKEGGGQQQTFVVPQPVPALHPPMDSAQPQSSAAPTATPAYAFGSAACVSTGAEACAFYLTALVAHALRMEDYWVDLGHQIEVDQHVEFLQFCADAGFGALKTMHLLQWWQQYRALVRDVAAAHTLHLSDGNPQRALLSPSPAAENASANSTTTNMNTSTAGTASTIAAASAWTGGETYSGNTNASAAARKGEAAAGGAKGGLKKGRRGSSTGGTTAAALDGGAPSSAAAVAPFAASSAPAAAYPSHDEAVRTELQRFVQWELEHEYEWRLVPREPFASSTPSSLLSPLKAPGGSGGAGPVAAAVGSAQVPSGKSSKADKAKMQLQQQQEMELEEQRLARIAALPPENIFLTKKEAEAFVRVVVTENLLTHAALHAYVATQARRPTRTLTHAAVAPVFFSVQVEVPMPVPSLRDATRLVAPTAVSPCFSPRLSSDATEGHTTTTTTAAATTTTTHNEQRSPSRLTGSGPPKPRSRGNSRNTAAAAATTDTTPTAAAATRAPEAAAGGVDKLAATQQLVLAVPSAMEALRAQQAEEVAAYRAAYAEEVAEAAAQAQQRQHAADVTLFFAKSPTKEAVEATYASMEDAVAARQQRILQRVAALERILGLTDQGEEAAAGAEVA
jgi:hypothetical protein